MTPRGLTKKSVFEPRTSALDTTLPAAAAQAPAAVDRYLLHLPVFSSKASKPAARSKGHTYGHATIT